MEELDYDYTRIDIEVDPNHQRMRGIAIHGNTPFDVPYISHITGNLWTGGCTTGLVLPDSFRHLISLYPWERYEVDHNLDSELYVRMYDSEDDVDSVKLAALAQWVRDCAKDGQTLVHCQAGLNRSNLVAGLALTLMGYSGKEAVAIIKEKRSPEALCNQAFLGLLESISGS